MIINTHTHLNSEKYTYQEKLNIIQKLEEQNILAIISGYNLKSSIEALNLAKLSPNLYASIGVSPNDLDDYNEEDLTKIIELAKDPKVIAIGEIGLDYYYSKELSELQKKVFISQIEIANELDLPIIIHSRDASQETISILKEHPAKKCGIMHCYSYSKELAKDFTKLGYLLAIGGVVTFKNARVLKEVVASTDLKHLVLETDCPYLSPEPFRGKTNYAYYVTYILEEIAKIKGIDVEEVERQTTLNVTNIFEV